MMLQLELPIWIDWRPLPPRFRLRRHRDLCMTLIQLEFELRYGRARQEIDDYALKSAEIHASNLVGNYGYTLSDKDDIRADLLAYLWERSDQFDPSRGAWSTFVTRVMKNRILNIISHRTAGKRDYRREISMEVLQMQRETSWS